MALKQVVDAPTELPVGLEDQYAERDGKWFLQADPPIEDVSGLKGALDKERGMRRDVEKQLVDWKTKYEGIDVDEYRKLQERVNSIKDAEIYDKDGIEALVQRRTDAMKAEHERQMGVKEREIGQLRTQATDYDRRWRQDRIKTSVLKAVGSSGVDKDAVEDAVARGLAVFNDLDDDGNVVAKKGDDVTYGKDGINPLNPEEWIATLKASGTARHLWPGSSGGGAPAHHATVNGQQIDWSKIPPAERMTLFRQQQATQNR